MPTNKPSPYLRFLNLLDAIDRINPGKKLDFIEESLLNKIVLASVAKQSVLVGDLISLSDPWLASDAPWASEEPLCDGLHQNGCQWRWSQEASAAN